MRKNLVLGLAAVLVVATAGCGKDPAPSAPPPGAPGSSLFPAPPPIADARPDIREKRTFQVPSRLVVERTGDRISVSVDTNALEQIEIEAGHKMVFGFKYQMFVTVGGQRKPMGSGMGGSPVIAASSVTRQLDGIPVEGQSYDVEVEFVLFETDIPAQHMWSPEAGKYRQLWARALKARC